MSNSRFFTFILFLLVVSCGQTGSNAHTDATKPHNLAVPKQAPWPLNIGQIPLPDGFRRVEKSAFGNYLSTLPLQAEGSKVKLYNGEEKWNQRAHYAVINLPIGQRDLHQCADAVMRVRADFLRTEKRYDDLHFNFTNGFNCVYSKWMDGYRVKVSGNNVSWYATEYKGDTDANYWKYLEMVWSYAGTLSLERELKTKDAKDIEPGDVWIKGGSPGHAVLVLDVAINNVGDKIFLLGQSYMPAQEMHVLKNPNDDNLSPWYKITEGDLVTPEWTFSQGQLRTWGD